MPKKAATIGSIRHQDGREAVLGHDGEWASDDTDLADYLNLAHFPGRYRTSPDILMPFGHGAIMRAARALRAEATFTNPPKPLPEGARM